MQPTFSSGSSALPVRRKELRRRSGQDALSLAAEVEGVASPTASSPSQQAMRLFDHVIDAYEDDPHRPKSVDDTFSEILYVTPTELDMDKLDTPTIKLVGSRGSDLDGTRLLHTGPDSSSLYDSPNIRVEAPLPPLPEEASWDFYHKSENEDSLSPIPLTPRPDGPSRFPSQDFPTSKASQRSIPSLFPRLPTPDFSVFRHNRLKQTVRTPLNFFRARTLSFVSAPPSRRSSIRLRSSQPTGSSDISRATSAAPVQLESLPSLPSRTESFESTLQSIGPSSTLCDDQLHAFFVETAPSRFTRKFPSPDSLSSFGKSISKQNTFDSMIASESGNNLGVEQVGKWTSYKWCLLLSVLCVFGYAMVGLVYSIFTWFGTHRHADVVWVADNDILIFVTLASTLLLLTGLVGLSGTLLNSRPILAFYSLLLWPSFVSVMVVGYTSYKREAFSLDRKLNMAWSQWYDDLDRLLIQESLHCCGFYNPLHEATFSKNCYPRTTLPGCKGKLFRFEKDNLRLCWRLAFSLVPLHVLNITVSLLCSNHVDRRFGKGLTPRAYRLSIADVRANADAVLAQFAETKIPSEPSRTVSHVTDREDRPPASRTQYEEGKVYEAIGQNFLSS